MPIAQEVQSWIDGMKAVGFTEEQIKPMLGVIESNEGAANYLKRSVMAPSEFSRQLDGLKAAEKAAKDELAKSTEWFQSVSQWKTDKEKEFLELQGAKTKLANVQARLADLKEKGYVDDTLLAGIDIAAPVSIPPKETKQYLTEEDFTKKANSYGVNLTKFSARMQKLARHHEQTFGKRAYDAADYQAPDFDGEKLIDHIDKNGGTLESAWQAVYGVDSRKSTLDTKERELDVNRRAEELYQKRVSSDIQAGKPVPFKPEQSNIRRIAGSVPEPSANPLQRRFDRINRTVAALDTARHA